MPPSALKCHRAEEQKQPPWTVVSSSSSDSDEAIEFYAPPSTSRVQLEVPLGGGDDVPTTMATTTRGISHMEEAGNNDLPSAPLHTVRVPLDQTKPSKGWLALGRIPTSIALGAADGSGLVKLLSHRPEELGQVVMFGKPVATPRYHQAYLQDYTFSGSHHAANRNLPDCIEELLDWVNSQRHYWTDPVPAPASTRTGPPPAMFNSSLVNWYMDGTHYMGPHRDDESNLHYRSPIFSASFGQTRTFRIRDGVTNKPVKDVTLRDRDFVVMGGAMQTHFKHEIVKVNGEKGKRLGARVNITFRQFRTEARTSSPQSELRSSAPT